MEIFLEPTVWMGLATLVLLEVILGIDNLVFIAILADKLPPEQRDKARVIGLMLALLMRLGLLAGISWIVTLTAPLFEVFGHPFSGRDLILLVGGLFLLFKATVELHSRVEGAEHAHSNKPRIYPKFAVVIAQIVVLDAVFSLDAVITAVGMVNELPVMMAAVIIAMIIMILASKPLTRFVNAHPTVVVLCLGFLLMIGFSLVAEGFGMEIPKGYLYAAIGFSILIEAINQFAFVKRRRTIASTTKTMRVRTTDAVLSLLGVETRSGTADIAALASAVSNGSSFLPEEQAMIRGVFTLSERPIASIMTPRQEVEVLQVNDDDAAFLAKVRASGHSRLIVVEGEMHIPVGIVYKKDVLDRFMTGEPIHLKDVMREPLFVPENKKVLSVLNLFKKEAVPLAVIVDEYGDFMGIVTPTDILEAIAGDLPDDDNDPIDIQEQADGSYLVSGGADIHDLATILNVEFEEETSFYTAAGLVLDILKRMPTVGDETTYGDWTVKVLKMNKNRVELLQFVPTQTA